MHAKPERVKRRRLARRMKAVASIGVAVAAGLFLACQRGVDKLVDATRSEGGDAAGDMAAPPAAIDAAPDAPVDAPVDAGVDAPADAKTDALAKHRGPRDAAVDVREHRKGMPVPDNLLE